jgi:hypothetical protein
MPTPAGGEPVLLTLEGHTGQTICFSDRPDRIIGATPTAQFLDGLRFARENPPNAALVADFEVGQGVAVLDLLDPIWDPDTGTLVYGAEWLEGTEAATSNRCSPSRWRHASPPRSGRRRCASTTVSRSCSA